MSITPVGASDFPGQRQQTSGRLAAAAIDFEALLLQQLMRFAKVDLGKGIAGDTYQDWFNSTLSDQLAQRQPLGIAAGILDQLQGGVGSSPSPGGLELQELVRSTAARHGLPAHLLQAVMQVESGGDPRAVSPRGARGLMQLMPDTATLLGVSDSFDPQLNLDGGARYLSSLLDRYSGDLDKALGAYNAGPGAVDRHDGIPPYPETERYIEKVRQLMSIPEEQ